MGCMGRNGPPKNPKPLLRPNGGKVTEKEKSDYLYYSFNYYKDRLVLLDSEKPLIFKKKWKEERDRVLYLIKEFEYQITILENPEIVKEIKECLEN
jgi:hypothetical protein